MYMRAREATPVYMRAREARVGRELVYHPGMHPSLHPWVYHHPTVPDTAARVHPSVRHSSGREGPGLKSGITLE